MTIALLASAALRTVVLILTPIAAGSQINDPAIQAQLEQARITSNTSIVVTLITVVVGGAFTIFNRRVRGAADIRGEDELALANVTADAESAREGQKAALALAAETRESAGAMLEQLRQQVNVAQGTIDRLNATIGTLTTALEVAMRGGEAQESTITILRQQLADQEAIREREEQARAALEETVRTKEREIDQLEADLLEATRPPRPHLVNE